MSDKFFLGLILLATTVWPWGCDRIGPGTVDKSAAKTAGITVAEALTAARPDSYEAMGTVQALTTSVVSSKLMGTVRSVAVVEGQRVEAGETLVVLDRRQVSAQLQQAEAALGEARKAAEAALSARESARAEAELARANYLRYVSMLKEEAVTQQEFDAVAARHRQAEAALSRSEAMTAAARSRVEQTRAAAAAAAVSDTDAVIAAAYDGIVVAKMVEVGDLATPGTPLVKIERADGFRVEVELPEGLIQDVRPGLTGSVRIPALAAAPMAGTVETIVPAADAASRTFLVKIRLPRTDDLKSGLFARVAIPLGNRPVLSLPKTAIIHEGQLTGIFIVGSDQIARFRLIRTGRILGDAVEVLSGLEPGARFVVAPPPGFADGTKVEETS